MNDVDISKFAMRPDAAQDVDGDIEVQFVDCYGKRAAASDAAIVAKSAYDAKLGRSRFYLKRAVAGPHQGEFFNRMTTPVEDLKFDDQSTQNYRYVWVEVYESRYRNYLDFLETGNPFFLHHAERE